MLKNHVLLFAVTLLLQPTPKPPPYQPKLLTPSLSCWAEGWEERGDWRYPPRRCLFLRMLADIHPEWSAARLRKFRRCTTEGEYVNHIVPGACGGCDVPSNMELMSHAEWAGRTGPERYDCGRHPGGEW